MNRRDLSGPAVRVLNRGGFANADVLLVPSPGGPVIVKDYAQRSAWVRAWLAPILVRRETGALRKAQGIPGVPAWSERVDKRALAMEYVDGRPIRRRWHSGRLPDAFFSALEGILEGVRCAVKGVVCLEDEAVCPWPGSGGNIEVWFKLRFVALVSGG